MEMGRHRLPGPPLETDVLLQGSPDPVLGSDQVTLVVSLALAVLVVATFLAVDRDRDGITGRVAVALGAGYATLCIGVWAGARIVAPVPLLERGIGALLVLFLIAGLPLCLQAAIPARLYGRNRLVTPLGWLVFVTTLLLTALLGVRGESDPLGLYVVFFPHVVAGYALLGGGEWVLRTLGARAFGGS